MASYNNYALENQCQPCNNNNNHQNIHHSQSSRMGPVNPMLQPQKAHIVSSRPPQSMHENHINNMIQAMNAQVVGQVSPQKAKASMTGYSAGVANFR